MYPTFTRVFYTPKITAVHSFEPVRKASMRFVKFSSTRNVIHDQETDICGLPIYFPSGGLISEALKLVMKFCGFVFAYAQLSNVFRFKVVRLKRARCDV